MALLPGNSVLVLGKDPSPSTVGVLMYQSQKRWYVAFDDGVHAYFVEDKLVRWPRLGDDRYVK